MQHVIPSDPGISPGGYRYFMLGAVLAIAYYSTARLGLSFATISASVTLLWPPSGIALFALVAFGIRLWPAVLLGALAANASTGMPVATAGGIAIGNCLEAIAGFYLLRNFGFQARRLAVRDIFKLVGLAAGLSTMIAATVGASMLLAFDIIGWDRFGPAWFTWWMGDAMGVLVFAPLLLAWWSDADDRWKQGQAAEAALLLLSLVVGTALIFGGYGPPNGTRNLPLAFMTFPLLTWAALRFGMRGATTATLVIGIGALTGIIAGTGLFARDSAIESLTLLWLYTNVLAVTGIVLAASVYERHHAEERFRHLAQHDVLTGLPNRITLQNQLALAMHRADRHQHMIAILFVDLDRFKIINDSFGHTVGDQLLKLAGARMRDCIRREDIVTRHGGDEFVIVLDEVKRSEDVVRVADKVLESLRSPFPLQPVPVHVSASIGISLYPADGQNVDTLLKNADTAMYRAKDQGRNAYVFYSPEMNARMAERLAIENDLRQALDRGEFAVHYQTQYDVATSQVIAAEALLRWRRADGQFVRPDTFIPILEEIGLINRIGAWVADVACGQLARWREQGMPDMRISVNVSSRQLRDPTLPQQVAEVLARHQVPANLLELEITESMLVSQSSAVEGIIQQLVDLGVRLAVDDFGTGYSSLSYLHRLSIDTLKIDRAFVHLLPAHENSAAIARAIVALGNSLHLTLVAEGVETSDQREFLSGLGCQIMQGYLFSRPVPAADVVFHDRSDSA